MLCLCGVAATLHRNSHAARLLAADEPDAPRIPALAPRVPAVEIAPDVRMPMISFGNLNDGFGDGADTNFSAAIAAGARGFDTAFIYGDSKQRDVGRAVARAVAGGIPRSAFFVTTKVWCCPAAGRPPKVYGDTPAPGETLDCSRADNGTARALHDLSALGLGYVDLLLLHFPCATKEATLDRYQQLAPLVASGLARAVGVSNFNTSMLDWLMARAAIPPAVNQAGLSVAQHNATFSLWGSDDRTVHASRRAGVTFEAYSPLGSLALHGSADAVLNDPTVAAVARAHNRSTCVWRGAALPCLAPHAWPCLSRRPPPRPPAPPTSFPRRLAFPSPCVCGTVSPMPCRGARPFAARRSP